MCHTKNSPPPNHDGHVKKKLHQTRSISMMKIIKEEEEEEEEEQGEEITPPKIAPVKPKRAATPRKSRRKSQRRKKPKYLSLRSSRLSARNDDVSAADEVDTDSKTTTTTEARQLNLFPLHPELNAAAELADHHSDDNVALLFESDGGATLQGLLTSAGTATTTTTSTMSSDHDQAAESNYSSYAYRGGGDVDIVRTAMRGSGGDRSVEKWVCYSELVKEEIELTATSSASTCCSVGDDRKRHQNQRLDLKLDYEEVLNAWSDKGSLYIKTEDGESPPQTVPDLLQDQLFQHLQDSSASIEDLWRVPEEEGGSGSGSLAKKTQRQESLLRYKRKRENRLFSKQIRYEVRKLNAEKRPRVKGRFVKSS